MSDYPFVITVSSEKGGVGKTTLAMNLAIFIKALREDLPVTVFSFDNHFTIDRMFEIKTQRAAGTVADLITGTPGHSLLHTGQYGVSYIPSSNGLSELRSSIQGPMFLTRMFATSEIPGIVIIDTRPELDILTQNALYAADQVFIPVKDMASLENCKNIFALFDSRGLDKKSLALIPCIIDSRIKFDGMFRDQRSLLKAYAINRGYACLDTFISKSPKVDSLNTNPDGKIYPILTHARGTDVYGQFAQIARHLIAKFNSTAENRALQYRKWLDAEEERREAAFSSRKVTLKPECPICSKPFIANGSDTAGFYYENEDGGARGYIHTECFHSLLMTLLNTTMSNLSPSDPFAKLLLEATSSATFILSPLSQHGMQQIELSAFDPDGKQLIRQLIPFRDYSESFMNLREGLLFRLIHATLGPKGLSDRGPYLAIHPIHSDSPEQILREDGYRRFRKIKQKAAALAIG